MTERHGLVFVVDDDDDIRESLEVLLRLHGYHVATAADGAEALQRLRALSPLPCLILLDLMMPGMNGFELRTAMDESQELSPHPRRGDHRCRRPGGRARLGHAPRRPPQALRAAHPPADRPPLLHGPDRKRLDGAAGPAGAPVRVPVPVCVPVPVRENGGSRGDPCLLPHRRLTADRTR